ncbi:hypothetical protein ANDA3_4577 [plant metagenome]|uniref:Uncharacterized protein n=2 Tax=root TaxID=1 RepID=A0A1C3K5Y9_9BURK|nr:hypothetical protein ODI_01041 [Orrella dioscoreae]SOE52525.1 hypothetical protein ODI_R4264 [Orrella dioscoreae]
MRGTRGPTVDRTSCRPNQPCASGIQNRRSQRMERRSGSDGCRYRCRHCRADC